MSALSYHHAVAAGLAPDLYHWPGVKVYIGGSSMKMNGRPMLLTGPRMFNPANPPTPRERFTPEHVAAVEGWLDSGAFQDVKPGRRLDPRRALDRQLKWESRARVRWNVPDWTVSALVSYDLLIDEKWSEGGKVKERWGVREAEVAVRATADAAAYFDSRRDDLRPRRLVMACQGVDAYQYEECAKGVLAHCRPSDVFGLGGWCILGRCRHYLPEFARTIRRVLPLVRDAGISHVHVFGVLWRTALGGLLWECDRNSLCLSTDSSSPVLAACWKTAWPSNKECERWEDNCVWWRETLANLRESPHYRPFPHDQVLRFTDLFPEETS